MTADLVAFLHARLDEDERLAQATCCTDWTDEGWNVLDSHAALDEGLVAQTVQFQADAAHIARHDPAGVLADVQAKRQIVDMYEHKVESMRQYPNQGNANGMVVLLQVLHALASVFADHPEFDPAWKQL